MQPATYSAQIHIVLTVSVVIIDKATNHDTQRCSDVDSTSLQRRVARGLYLIIAVLKKTD